jgi:hypothetical protein
MAIQADSSLKVDITGHTVLPRYIGTEASLQCQQYKLSTYYTAVGAYPRSNLWMDGIVRLRLAQFDAIPGNM